MYVNEYFKKVIDILTHYILMNTYSIVYLLMVYK